MNKLKYIFGITVLAILASDVYSQSMDMFFDKGKELYEQGNYEKAIKNFELYLKYETTNPKAEAKQLLEQAKKKLAAKADTPTNSEQVAPAEIAPPTEKPSPKVTEKPHEEYFIETALGLNMKMIYVEGGTFMMGALADDKDAFENEKPQYQVTLDSYYIAEFEVTQSQWEKVMSEPSFSYKLGKDNYPINNIKWDEAVSFCQKLSEITGKTYLLPTEAQWEYAARGGKKSKGYKYSGSNNVDDVAWHDGPDWQSDALNQEIHSVGEKLPNELGIYDMSGNVSEWCSDWYGGYSSSPQTNPKGPESGDKKIIRGGDYCNKAPICSIVYRRYSHNLNERYWNNGFRVVCIPD